MNVFDLSARLTLNKDEYDKGLTDAKDSGEGFASKLGGALSTAGKTAGAVMAGVGTAVVGVGVALTNGIKNTAEYGDNIDKMSQKLGISAKSYQEWDFIAQHSGTTMASVQGAIKTLTKDIGNNSEAFEQLGLSMEDVQGMNQEELFSAVITGLQGMEEGTERASLAQSLLGKGAMELAPLLNTSAEATEEMRQQVNDLGGVMSDEAVKASAGFQDAMQNLGTAVSGLMNGAMSELLPMATDLIDGLTAIFSGDDSGIGKIADGVQGIADKILEALPTIANTGMQILERLVASIMDSLPTLIDTGVQIVMKLAEMIIDNLPKLVEAGLQIIVTLATAIGESLPDLIPTIVDVILTIVESLIDNVDKLIDGAIAIIVGLAEGLIDALPRLIEKAPVILIKLVTALISAVPKLWEASRKMIDAIWKGITQNLPTLISKIPEIWDKCKEALVEGIQKIKDIGSEFIENLWSGISDKIEWIKDKIKGFGEAVLGSIKSIFGIGGDKGADRGVDRAVFGIDTASNAFTPVVSRTVIAQNDRVVQQLKDMQRTMTQSFIEALANGLSWEWDDRTLGRMIKNYA